MNEDTTNILLIQCAVFVILAIPAIVEYLLFRREQDHEYPELTRPREFHSMVVGTLYFYFVSVPSVIIRKLLGIPAKPGRPGRLVGRERSKRSDSEFFREATSQFKECRQRFFIMFIVVISYMLSVAVVIGAIAKIVTSFYALLLVGIFFIAGVILYRRLSVWIVSPVLKIIK